MANLSQQKRDRMIEFLRQLKEEHIDDDKSLIALSEIENELLAKKYGLIWEQHEEQVDIDMRDNVPVFTEIKEREIVADESSDSYNFLLEGDNLHSLKLLEKTHRGRIDVIYIDPPYNTGGTDFRYNDECVDKTNAFRHSKWLSFMSERLRIMRELLSPNGMIYISIDDIEQAPLTMLCNEIFGEENHVETIIWKSKYGAGAKTVGFISVHEYILCYSRNPISDLTSELDEEGQSKYNKKDEYFDTRGGYLTQPLMTTSLADRPNLQYSIEYQGVTIHPKKQWVWSKERLEEAIKNNEVVFNLQKDGTYSVRAKKYLYDDNGNVRRGKPISIMNGPFTQDGTTEIREIFGTEDAFKFTKPSELIRFFIALEINGLSSKDAIVLDAFAGSGTTAEAVLKQNKNDGGNRKFILCTNNENNICEEVTYERIKRVIRGYSDKEGILSNVKYYKTDMIPKTSDDEDYLVGDKLLEHIREMVQLENLISLDDNKYLILLTDEDADELEKQPERLKMCKGIYISSQVFLTSSQKKLFKGVTIKQIPDYYFEEELREVSEIW